jgi:GNAT superfamily N-acetyltransferase
MPPPAPAPGNGGGGTGAGETSGRKGAACIIGISTGGDGGEGGKGRVVSGVLSSPLGVISPLAANGNKPDPTADTVHYRIRSGVRLCLRLFDDRDLPALRALYADGQASHARDAASTRVHGSWCRHVLSSDMTDVRANHLLYPRSRFWVATVMPADFELLSGLVAAADGGRGGTDAQPHVLAAISAEVPPPGGVAVAQRTSGGYYADGEGNAILGYVAAVPHQDTPAGHAARAEEGQGDAGTPPWVSTTRTAELKRMCVDERVRRCGVARTLIAHLEAWCTAAGYGRVYLDTLASMREGVQLYTAAGFAFVSPPNGVATEFGGDVIYVVELAKQLAQPPS